MRTNIDIDDELLAEAMRITGLTTKKAAVEEALRQIVREAKLRTVIREMEGLGWEGDLEAIREGWGPAEPLSEEGGRTARTR